MSSFGSKAHHLKEMLMSRVKRTPGGDEIAAHSHDNGYYKDYRIKDFLEVEDTQLQTKQWPQIVFWEVQDRVWESLGA